MMRIHFVVPGKAIAQPRHRFRKDVNGNRRPYIPASHPVHAFKSHVQIEYRRAAAGTLLRPAVECFTGPVKVEIHALLARSKKGTEYWATDRKFDLDNMAKAVLDALNKLAYADDSQVCFLEVRKTYTDGNDRTVVTLTDMSADF